MPTFEEHLVSLQQTNADLVTSNNELTKNVIDKLAHINQRVDSAEQQMNGFAQDLLKHRIVGGNLLMDPWLMNTTLETVDGVEKLVPATPPFLPSGDAKMEVVSQDTYAFGTRYAHANVKEMQLSQPDNYTDDPWQATPEKPIYAHMSDKHIMSYGALSAPEWSGLKKRGYITKLSIDKKTEQSAKHASLNLHVGQNRAFAGGLFLFRAWVYLKQGTLIFGDHAGYNRSTNGQFKIDSDSFSKENANHPYQLIEFFVKPYRYCGNGLASLNFASGDNNSYLECYIASPQLFALDHPDDKKKPMSGETFGGHYA
ncbi:hypothetical protein [Pseudoalteromonas sp. T1lg23B]|uniref:hypothetical protein n=1 Tax=Pseudoalteromonas sp. T1lg23B TaxID=2077097 RepID=UPI000CF738E1|nr:hypothetical protein [Pseudoalteromonas sp. T1lg23B]